MGGCVSGIDFPPCDYSVSMTNDSDKLRNQQKWSQHKREKMESVFKVLDANNDGALDAAEFDEVGWGPLIQHLDKDKNGKVSLNEFIENFQGLPEAYNKTTGEIDDDVWREFDAGIAEAIEMLSK